MLEECEIKHPRLKKIVDNFRNIEGWLHEHRIILELIKKDHQLLTRDSPYKLHFAVDFHEIYNIVFPVNFDVKIKETEQNNWVHDNVVNQSGRICLFYGIDNSPVPILLPPYRDELEDFLFWLRSEYKKISHQYSILKELKTAIKNLWQDEDIKITKRENGYYISDENYKKIFDFIKTNFFQLCFLLMGGYTEIIPILKTLFDDNRLELISKRWPGYTDLINEKSKKIPDQWQQYIKRIRGESSRGSKIVDRDIERANFRDLRALHIIKLINNRMRNEKKSEIILLVSDAEIFSSLLNNSLYDTKDDYKIAGKFQVDTGEIINILRTTRVFHTYLLAKEEREELKKIYNQSKKGIDENKNYVVLINVTKDLEKMSLIEAFSKEMDKLIEFCNNRKKQCDKDNNCPSKEFCKETEDVIHDFTKDKKALESLNLADKFKIYAKIYKYYNDISSIDIGTKNIFRLLQDDKKIIDIIEKKLTQLRENLNKGFEGLTLKSLYIKNLPYVPKVPKENAFRIKTYDEELDIIIKNIEISIRLNDQNKFEYHFSKLKSKNDKMQKNKSLEYLLSSLLAAAYEDYDLSLYFLERGLIFTGNKTRYYSEYLFLFTIIYCIKRSYQEALSLCKKLISEYSTDPRFPYFYAFIILTAKEENELEHDDYEDAVTQSRRTLGMMKEMQQNDEELKQAVLNNLIYGLSKIGTHDAIKDAEKKFSELKQLATPERHWGEQIWHTVGSLFLSKSLLLKKEGKNYKSSVEEAIQYYIKGNKRAHDKNKLILNDLKKAKELLKG